MLFKDLIDHLNSNNMATVANTLQSKVQKFLETIGLDASEQEIQNLPYNDILNYLNTYNFILQTNLNTYELLQRLPVDKADDFVDFIESLQRDGFSVGVNDKYQL
ncbi:MAG: hypothetical protein FWF27_04635 [Candidatus Bathyarchaeota archaeon]|nr:hypothetical protein [Candidatus Termiticorpusculum sp.]